MASFPLLHPVFHPAQTNKRPPIQSSTHRKQRQAPAPGRHQQSPVVRSLLLLVVPCHFGSAVSAPLVAPCLFLNPGFEPEKGIVFTSANPLPFGRQMLPCGLQPPASGSSGGGSSHTSSVPDSSAKVAATENLAASFRGHTGHSSTPHHPLPAPTSNQGLSLGVVGLWRANLFLKAGVYYAKIHKLPDPPLIC